MGGTDGRRRRRREETEDWLPEDTSPWPASASGRCVAPGCGGAGTDQRPLLPCDGCGEGVHRDCAGFTRKAYSWNRGYLCDVCRVTRLDRTYEDRPDLHRACGSRWDRDKRRKLMRAANVIRARAWTDGTWGAMAYHLQRVIAFERETGIPVLPMTEDGMMAFFTWLIERAPTWRAVRSARSAIRAWHICAGLGDPFLDRPEQDLFLRGLKRTVTLWARKKLPMPVEWVVRMIAGLFSDPRTPRRLALRDATILILGFFGFRRHSEVVLHRDPLGPQAEGAAGGELPGDGESMGLRREDVTFFPRSRRVRLFIRRMKNDPFGLRCRGPRALVEYSPPRALGTTRICPRSHTRRERERDDDDDDDGGRAPPLVAVAALRRQRLRLDG